MKVSEMIKNLQSFMKTNGDLECWYAADDEGNYYNPVFYEPSLYYIDPDNNEVYRDTEELEDCGIDMGDVVKACIIN